MSWRYGAHDAGPSEVDAQSWRRIMSRIPRGHETTESGSRRRRFVRVAAIVAVIAPSIPAFALSTSANGSPTDTGAANLIPGNLLVSRSVYEDVSGILPGTVLPPGCTSGCGAGNPKGSYPLVFKNGLVDGSFGIPSPVFLDQIPPRGALVKSIEVPNSL